MVKKVLLTVLVALFCSAGFAEEKAGLNLGVGGIMLGFDSYNAQNQMESTLGLNCFLGITFKQYFKPVRYKAWNPFWHGGTVIGLIPFLGIGADYFWDDTIYFGFETYWIILSFHLNFAL
jgi:hypothetical protein